MPQFGGSIVSSINCWSIVFSISWQTIDYRIGSIVIILISLIHPWSTLILLILTILVILTILNEDSSSILSSTPSSSGSFCTGGGKQLLQGTKVVLSRFEFCFKIIKFFLRLQCKCFMSRTQLTRNVLLNHCKIRSFVNTDFCYIH